VSKILVIGFGNDILKDDRIGLEVVRQVKKVLEGVCDVVEEPLPGPSLIDLWAGYERAILVDGVITGKAPPGTLHVLSIDDFIGAGSPSPHYAGLSDVVALSRKLELPMPREILVFAIEVEDPYSFEENLSPAVKCSLPSVVERVVDKVKEWLTE